MDPANTVSIYQPVDMICPECRVGFLAEVWLIVDERARPDLWEECRRGRIHTFACPNRHWIIADAHLLLYSSAQGRVIFSPARETTPEQDSAALYSLLKILQDALPSAASGADRLFVESVQREMLGRALDNAPGGRLQFILREIQQQFSASDMPRRIQLCREALRLCGRTKDPELWAKIQFELGASYHENLLGDRAMDLEQAIKAYKKALSVFTPRTFPDEWAATQNHLGIAYFMRIRGRRAENLERAIHYYEAALTVRTRQASPLKWALVLTNLSNSYRERIRGDKAKNLEMAIQCCESALNILTPDNFPYEWANANNNLGVAYSGRILGSRAENIDKAIQFFEAALTVLTREKHPADWARTKDNLGSAFRDRIYGDPGANLARAIRAYEDALGVHSPETNPQEWARVQNNVGDTYRKDMGFNRMESLERAIQAHEAALTVFTREAYPEKWASTQDCLGNAYGNRMMGLPAENMETAIRAYESALTVFTPRDYPQDWSRVQNNLGDTYRKRVEGSRAENIEKAIQCLDAALTVRSRESSPEQWAITQNNLGVAYSERIEGDRAENMEMAIEAYQRALTVYSIEAFPERWAATQNDLGGCYMLRVLGDQSTMLEKPVQYYGDLSMNLERAIEYYEAALTIYTKEAFPYRWATTQVNLGEAFRMRVLGEKEDNIEHAIELLEAALTVLTHDKFPEQWARAHNNLGNASWVRVRGDRAENIEKSRLAYEKSLTVFTRNRFPEDWARIQNNLGNAYRGRIEGERSKNQALSALAYRRALQVHSPDSFPLQARDAARNLALLEIEQENWSEAYSAMLIAVEAAENLYGAAITEQGKAVEVLHNSTLYEQMVDVCLRLEPPKVEEAFLYAEDGRSRLLRDQLGGLRFPPPGDIPLGLLAEEARLLKVARNLENLIRAARNDGKERRRLAGEATNIRHRLNALWNELTKDYGASEYVALRRGEKLSWPDLQSWLAVQGRPVALLEFFVVEDSLVLFVIRNDDTAPRVARVDLSRQQMLECLGLFFNEVHNFSSGQPAEETWQEALHDILPHVMPHLEGVDVLYIIPHWIFHHLPLHALQYQGKPLIEYFAIVYAPSAATAIRLTRLLPPVYAAEEKGKSTFVAGNPQPMPSHLPDLLYAEEEAKMVAKHFGIRPLLRQEVSKAAVISELPGKKNVHFVTHAYFDPDNPFMSGIILANGDVLTAGEMLGQYVDCQLLVLSGCETAVQAVGLGDELAGLARAFLYAGVSTLVLSLWKVNDLSGALFISHFYNSLYDRHGVKKMSIAEALRAAMLATREDVKHTYYWAPFVLFGAWR